MPGPQAARVYVYTLILAAAAALGCWLYFFGVSFSWRSLAAASVLALVCAVSRRFPFKFANNTVEIVDVAILSALVLLGPVWALVAAAPSVLYRDRLRSGFVASTQVLALLAAGYVLALFTEPALSVLSVGAATVYGVAAAGAAYYVVEVLLNGALVRLKYGDAPLPILKDNFLPLLPSNAVAILTALGISWALVSLGPAAALILFVGSAGAAASLYLLREYKKENDGLAARNAELEAEVEGLYRAAPIFAARMVESLGRKDGRTARHAASSAVYAADVAAELGFKTAEVEKIRTAALLQDAGLISVSDEVLLTPPEKLNSVGRLQLEEHTLHGERLLSAAPGFEEAARWVRWHHESVDGTGYPDKLRGEWIPPEAKILAVCGAYAALILDGPSSPGLSPQEARRELAGLSGKSLDETVVRTLLRLLDAEGGNYAAAADERFALPAHLAPGGRAAGAAGTPGASGVVPDLRPTGTVEND